MIYIIAETQTKGEDFARVDLGIADRRTIRVVTPSSMKYTYGVKNKDYYLVGDLPQETRDQCTILESHYGWTRKELP